MAIRDEIRVDGLPPGVVADAPTVGEAGVTSHGEASDWEVPQARSAQTPPHVSSPPPAGGSESVAVQPEPVASPVPLEGPDTIVYVVIEDLLAGEQVMVPEAVQPLTIPWDFRSRADAGDPAALAAIANALLQTVTLQENPPEQPDVTRPCIVDFDEDANRLTIGPRVWSEDALMWSIDVPDHATIAAVVKAFLPQIEERVNAGARADDELTQVQTLLAAAAAELPPAS